MDKREFLVLALPSQGNCPPLMYTNEDLNLAIKQGIFSHESVTQFRSFIASEQNSPAVDEENFRLIGGFNDIFIVIACGLLLFCSKWAVGSITNSDSIGLIVFTLLSWALAEYFILKRKMAFPAIALLLSCVGGTFAFGLSFFPEPSEIALITAAALASISAYLHWLRFTVPITVAVGTAALGGLIVSTIITLLPIALTWISTIFFICGILVFIFAMYWDASDTDRTTRKSDVAFWLHLLSAPLMMHSVFSSLGVLEGNQNLGSTAAILALYLCVTIISILIDRRAFMVSSLFYVLYAVSSIFDNFGGVGYSFALTGVVMGGSLLLLSAYWHKIRASLVSKLPGQIIVYLPKVKAL